MTEAPDVGVGERPREYLSINSFDRYTPRTPREENYGLSNSGWGWIGAGLVVVLGLICAIGFGREYPRIDQKPSKPGVTAPVVPPQPPPGSPFQQ